MESTNSQNFQWSGMPKHLPCTLHLLT